MYHNHNTPVIIPFYTSYELDDNGRAAKQGTCGTGIYYDSSAEIVDYDAASKRLFVTNTATNSVMILNVADMANIAKVTDIDLNAYGTGVNSVTVHNGLIAVAVERKE